MRAKPSASPLASKASSTFRQIRAKPSPAQDTRQTLIRIAMEIIAEKGLRGLSFGSISEQAGVSKSLVAYHFGSKVQLIHHLLDKALEKRMQIYEESRKGGLDGLDAWFQVLDKASPLLTDHIDVRSHSILLADGLLDDDKQIRQRIIEYHRSITNMIARAFEEELAKRNIKRPKISAEMMAIIYLSSSRSLAMQWLSGCYEFDVKLAIGTLRGMMKDLITKSGKEQK